MSTEPTFVVLDAPVAQRRWILDSATLRDYLALTKPEVNFLIGLTTFAAFYLSCAAESRSVPVVLLLNAVLGTLLVAAGAGTLNQYIERHFDAQMRRTSRRPLAAGRLTPSVVLRFGLALTLGGSILLLVAVNALASFLAIFTLLSYLFLYTPLKRKTPLCTLIGAISGAMPPLIGWASASGTLSVGGWMLFGVIFLWQFPHFMAIAWMYREDYDRAGYKVLPHGNARAGFAVLQTILPLLLLILLSVVANPASVVYCTGALLLGVGFLYYGAQFALRRSMPSARRLLTASIIYVPLVFALMMMTP
jgi:protoheme IX farnesyltransferase